MSGLDAGPPPEAFDPSGDGDQTESGPTDGTESEPDKWWGLRRSEPPIAPRDVGHQLDVQADWWQHLGCGFIKQSGSGGAEAWMHYLMAAFLLVAEIFDVDVGDDDGDKNESGGPLISRNPESNAGLEPTGKKVTDDTRTFDGPQ